MAFSHCFATGHNKCSGAAEHCVWAAAHHFERTHFMVQRAQQWAKEQDIEWQLHVPYRPQAAGMVEWFNGLLKETLWALGGTSPWKQ